MDFESKEERSIGTLVSRKTEEKYQSNLTEERIEGTAMSEVEKAVKSPSRGEGIEFPDGTESEVTTKIPHSVDTDYDPSQAVFVNPDEGTPAAEALAANAALVVSKVTKGLHKLKVKRLTMNRLNIVKRLKKNTKGSQFSQNFKGKVIDGLHELYTLTAGMMLGIRCSVGRTSLDNREQLRLGDFSHVEKMTFPPTGSNKPGFSTPPHSLAHTFKFKSYSLQVFRRIRNFFGIDNAEYMMSVCGNYNFLEFISNSKSGQFFFYSHDGKYMIKTQTKEENKFMKRILPHYYKFVTENPHTMLVRILGMHRVKMYHLRRKVHFVIMTSVFDTPEKIHTVYDLKGSLIGRQATAKERAHGGVLKDMDLVIDKVKLNLGVKKATFMVQVEKDANFLAELNIMDYSLLVGIHYRNRRQTVNFENPDEHEIAGPVGQHSNTPFRRNMTSAPASASSNRPVSPNNSPYVASQTRKISAASPHVSRPPSTTTRVREGDYEYGCDVDSDPFSAVRRRNSLRSRNVPGPDGVESDGFQVRKNRLRADSPKSMCSSNDDSVDEVFKVIGTRRGSRILRPASTGVTGTRKKTPPRRPDSTVPDLRALRLADAADTKYADTKATPYAEEPDDMDFYDDDEYSIDEDDTDMDFVKSDLETEGEEEDHYDDGDSDMEFETPFVANSKVPPIAGFDTLIRDSKSDKLSPVSPPHTRRECEDEGEGLKGIEGSQLAPMVRMSFGGFLRALPSKMRGKKANKAAKAAKEAKDGKDKEEMVESASAQSCAPAICSAVIDAAVVRNAHDDYGKETMITFGPGASQRHPWTLRKDSGINSREADGRRGDEIYYIGVIDILQQYNLRKRAETAVKSVNNDSTQISSVDAHLYAKRFVKFIEGNTI